LAKKFKKKVDLKFRDFAYRDDRGASTYKFTWHANKYIKAKYGMIPIQIEFMLFAYDLEFFTIEWMAQTAGEVLQSNQGLANCQAKEERVPL
jgi:hypothetical protein